MHYHPNNSKNLLPRTSFTIWKRVFKYITFADFAEKVSYNNTVSGLFRITLGLITKRNTYEILGL